MIEVRIQCICKAIQLPDLGEKLHRGDVLFISKTRADKSKDLATAKAAGAVLCQEVTRCQEQRPAPLTKPNPYILKKDPHSKIETKSASKPKIESFDPDEMARDIAEKVAKALNRTVHVHTMEPEPDSFDFIEVGDSETEPKKKKGHRSKE